MKPPALSWPARAAVVLSSALPSSALPSSVVPSPSGMPAADWDVLFNAVKTRLKSSVDETLAMAGHPAPAAIDLGTQVLDCIAALEQLHATLAQERSQHLGIERTLHRAQTELAQAQAELAGTRAAEQQARHRARHDELTALPNRSGFRERLDDALAPGQRRCPALVLLYLDIDAFKAINDQHGHGVGDEVLRIVAARLRGAMRPEDMVGRLGGDEFACMLPESMSRQQLSDLAGKLFEAVSATLTVGELELAVTPSIGIARCPDDGGTAEALLQHADAAMYRAKRCHTGHAFFDPCTDM